MNIFSGDHLRATVFVPDAPNGKLLVTFRQRIPDPGAFAAALPMQSALKQGTTHLFLQSRLNDWFINRETAALAAALFAFTAPFQTATAIGFSMGGYAALRFSAALRLTQVLLISPQFSIHPDVVPFDLRFRENAAGFDAASGDLRTHANPALQGALIYDPFRTPDRLNARLIAAAFPRIDLCHYAFGGHPATGVLRETVGFPALQRLAIAGKITRPQILALHRTNRSAAPSYWRNLAKHARPLHPQLAARAEANRTP